MITGDDLEYHDDHVCEKETPVKLTGVDTLEYYNDSPAGQTPDYDDVTDNQTNDYDDVTDSQTNDYDDVSEQHHPDSQPGLCVCVPL
ncbi:GRIP and coiled-coil domain-containing protein-like isoform X2 [Brienomyrus brachyistius]|uniref:GRIP and coiled-coil domain-containing protein-like isoform X2 n=1 Tax=Brienomyrus brachyistius TaxID=42636 RepID=UPI0020B39CC0|nr:GRIP and coiled-coil domain-containing protein-like isoform X2 [Brienomyrus brachyistius]